MTTAAQYVASCICEALKDQLWTLEVCPHKHNIIINIYNYRNFRKAKLIVTSSSIYECVYVSHRMSLGFEIYDFSDHNAVLNKIKDSLDLQWEEMT
jgi:hypothetical protein